MDFARQGKPRKVTAKYSARTIVLLEVEDDRDDLGRFEALAARVSGSPDLQLRIYISCD